METDGIKTRALAAAFSAAVALVGLSVPAGAGVVTPTPNETPHLLVHVVRRDDRSWRPRTVLAELNLHLAS